MSPLFWVVPKSWWWSIYMFIFMPWTVFTGSWRILHSAFHVDLQKMKINGNLSMRVTLINVDSMPSWPKENVKKDCIKLTYMYHDIRIQDPWTPYISWWYAFTKTAFNLNCSTLWLCTKQHFGHSMSVKKYLWSTKTQKKSPNSKDICKWNK